MLAVVQQKIKIEVEGSSLKPRVLTVESSLDIERELETIISYLNPPHREREVEILGRKEFKIGSERITYTVREIAQRFIAHSDRGERYSILLINNDYTVYESFSLLLAPAEDEETSAITYTNSNTTGVLTETWVPDTFNGVSGTVKIPIGKRNGDTGQWSAKERYEAFGRTAGASEGEIQTFTDQIVSAGTGKSHENSIEEEFDITGNRIITNIRKALAPDLRGYHRLVDRVEADLDELEEILKKRFNLS